MVLELGHIYFASSPLCWLSISLRASFSFRWLSGQSINPWSNIQSKPTMTKGRPARKLSVSFKPIHNIY